VHVEQAGVDEIGFWTLLYISCNAEIPRYMDTQEEKNQELDLIEWDESEDDLEAPEPYDNSDENQLNEGTEDDRVLEQALSEAFFGYVRNRALQQDIVVSADDCQELPGVRVDQIAEQGSSQNTEKPLERSFRGNDEGDAVGGLARLQRSGLTAFRTGRRGNEFVQGEMASEVPANLKSQRIPATPEEEGIAYALHQAHSVVWIHRIKLFSSLADVPEFRQEVLDMFLKHDAEARCTMEPASDDDRDQMAEDERVGQPTMSMHASDLRHVSSSLSTSSSSSSSSSSSLSPAPDPVPRSAGCHLFGSTNLITLLRQAQRQARQVARAYQASHRAHLAALDEDAQSNVQGSEEFAQTLTQALPDDEPLDVLLSSFSSFYHVVSDIDTIAEAELETMLASSGSLSSTKRKKMSASESSLKSTQHPKSVDAAIQQALRQCEKMERSDWMISARTRAGLAPATNPVLNAASGTQKSRDNFPFLPLWHPDIISTPPAAGYQATPGAVESPAPTLQARTQLWSTCALSDLPMYIPVVKGIDEIYGDVDDGELRDKVARKYVRAWQMANYSMGTPETLHGNIKACLLKQLRTTLYSTSLLHPDMTYPADRVDSWMHNKSRVGGVHHASIILLTILRALGLRARLVFAVPLAPLRYSEKMYSHPRSENEGNEFPSQGIVPLVEEPEHYKFNLAKYAEAYFSVDMNTDKTLIGHSLAPPASGSGKSEPSLAHRTLRNPVQSVGPHRPSALPLPPFWRKDRWLIWNRGCIEGESEKGDYDNPFGVNLSQPCGCGAPNRLAELLLFHPAAGNPQFKRKQRNRAMAALLKNKWTQGWPLDEVGQDCISTQRSEDDIRGDYPPSELGNDLDHLLQFMMAKAMELDAEMGIEPQYGEEDLVGGLSSKRQRSPTVKAEESIQGTKRGKLDENAKAWVCSVCTLENSSEDLSCLACDNPAPHVVDKARNPPIDDSSRESSHGSLSTFAPDMKGGDTHPPDVSMPDPSSSASSQQEYGYQNVPVELQGNLRTQLPQLTKELIRAESSWIKRWQPRVFVEVLTMNLCGVCRSIFILEENSFHGKTNVLSECQCLAKGINPLRWRTIELVPAADEVTVSTEADPEYAKTALKASIVAKYARAGRLAEPDSISLSLMESASAALQRLDLKVSPRLALGCLAARYYSEEASTRTNLTFAEAFIQQTNRRAGFTTLRDRSEASNDVPRFQPVRKAQFPLVIACEPLGGRVQPSIPPAQSQGILPPSCVTDVSERYHLTDTASRSRLSAIEEVDRAWLDETLLDIGAPVELGLAEWSFWRDVEKSLVVQAVSRSKLRDVQRSTVTAQGCVQNPEFLRQQVEELRATVSRLKRLRLGDLKNHPLLCTPKFLKRDEIIYPDGEEFIVTRITTLVRRNPQNTPLSDGKDDAPLYEEHPVYPRAHLHQLKTEQQWLREGKVIRQGEQPFRIASVPVRAGRRLPLSARYKLSTDAATEAAAAAAASDINARATPGPSPYADHTSANFWEELETSASSVTERIALSLGSPTYETPVREQPETKQVPLYGSWQTEMITKEMVNQGGIPTNQYGNVEVLRPEHVPPGCAHVTEDLAKEAAIKLGIPFAPAVVGFDRSSNRPTFQGIVVKAQNAALLRDASRKLQEIMAKLKREKRTRFVLARWRLLAKKLVVRRELDRRMEHVRTLHSNISGGESYLDLPAQLHRENEL